MARFGLILIAILGIPAGCVRAQSVAQGPESPAILGLISQTAGFGGCRRIDHTEVWKRSVYSAVVVIEGMCFREHADTAMALVALDSAGQVYVLNSPSGLAFMLRMHPYRLPSQARVLPYAVAALAMSGAIHPLDTLVESTLRISDKKLAQMGVARDRLRKSSRVMQNLLNGFEVAVTTLGPGGLSSIRAIVDADSGFVTMTTIENWKDSSRKN